VTGRFVELDLSELAESWTSFLVRNRSMVITIENSDIDVGFIPS